MRNIYLNIYKANLANLRRAKNNKNPFSEPKGNYAGLKLRGTFEENNNPEESLSENLPLTRSIECLKAEKFTKRK